MKYILAAVYLAAVIGANLAVAAFGPGASIVIAFLAIGLTLTTRDLLHEQWGRAAVPVSLGLILLGGGASYLLNGGAGPVALASCVAFLASEAVDLIVYLLAGFWGLSGMPRVNTSNAAGAIVDSLVFPTLAFGGFSLAITSAQFLAKCAGGALFIYLAYRFAHRRLNLAPL